jgi:glutaminyl-peptide cyclotransferase
MSFRPQKPSMFCWNCKSAAKNVLFSLLLLLLLWSCDEKKSSEQTTENQANGLVKTPAFNADSAYGYVAAQVAFGPRVPNSSAHTKCGDYLAKTLQKWGCTVVEQRFVAINYDGKKLNARNIVGSINPQATKRILLASHWDSRPVADQDPANKTGPIAGANDGASGVAVLLELMRVLTQANPKPSVGVDVIFFDVEDGGNSELAKDKYSGFCLGSQYWAANKHTPNYAAYYGILLDMVGAKGATFPREGFSMQYANDITRNIWNMASQMGYSQYFIDYDGGAITDDHLPVNELGKIPMIDIIHQQINNPNKTFFEDWHTHEDDLRNIDRPTLKAVGEVLLQALYQEKI